MDYGDIEKRTLTVRRMTLWYMRQRLRRQAAVPEWARSRSALEQARRGLLLLVDAAMRDVADAKRSAAARREGASTSVVSLKCDTFYSHYFAEIVRRVLTRARFSRLRQFVATSVASGLDVDDDAMFGIAVVTLHGFKRCSATDIRAAVQKALESVSDADLAVLAPALATSRYSDADAETELPEWALSDRTVPRLRTGLLRMIDVEMRRQAYACPACRRGVPSKSERLQHWCAYALDEDEYFSYYFSDIVSGTLTSERVSRLRAFMRTARADIGEDTLFGMAVTLMYDLRSTEPRMRDAVADALDRLSGGELATLTPEGNPSRAAPAVSPISADDLAQAEQFYAEQEEKVMLADL